MAKSLEHSPKSFGQKRQDISRFLFHRALIKMPDWWICEGSRLRLTYPMLVEQGGTSDLLPSVDVQRGGIAGSNHATSQFELHGDLGVSG